MSPKLHADSGQVTVLVVGMALVVFAVAGLAVDGTRAFLHRRHLQNAADGASLAAADQVDRDVFYTAGGEVVRIDPDAARDAVSRWLGTLPRGSGVEMRIDASTIEVAIRGEVDTRFLRLLGIDVIRVGVVSRAQPELGSSP